MPSQQPATSNQQPAFFFMRTIDQLGNEINLAEYPERIISLVPSQTELLHYLELDDKVVGITRFCIHPEEWYRKKNRVGGTKNLHFDKIRELNPDIIIGNKEENEEHQIKELMKEFPVWMSDILTLENALEMILAIGELTGKQDKAVILSKQIQDGFDNLIPIKKSKSVAYLIWRNPYMAAGGGTFIDDMLQRCGFINVFKNHGRYPKIYENELIKNKPDFVFLSSEPYPFKEKHISEIFSILPKSKIHLVDGELFSWYGSRLLHSPKYFEKLMKVVS